MGSKGGRSGWPGGMLVDGKVAEGREDWVWEERRVGMGNGREDGRWEGEGECTRYVSAK